MFNLLNKIINFKQGNILIHILRYRKFLRFPYVKIDFGVEIWNKKNKKIGKNSWIRKGAIIQDGELEIGQNTNIGPYTCIFPGILTKIGNNVLIGPNVGIYGGTHNFKKKNITIINQGDSSKGIIIEDDVWIGANSVIIDGVTIKKGSVIGAGSIVTKNTEKYSIYVGNPAKIIGYRE